MNKRPPSLPHGWLHYHGRTTARGFQQAILGVSRLTVGLQARRPRLATLGQSGRSGSMSFTGCSFGGSRSSRGVHQDIRDIKRQMRVGGVAARVLILMCYFTQT